MKISRLTVAGVLALAVLDPGIAQAEPEGTLCDLAAVQDVTADDDTRTGVVSGGPIADPDDPTAQVALTCTVQVGPAGATHAGADAASATGSGTGAAVVVPTQVSFVAPSGSDVYVCTSAVVDGVTYYYDDANAAWSTSASVSCKLTISQDFVCLDYLWEHVIDFTFCILGM